MVESKDGEGKLITRSCHVDTYRSGWSLIDFLCHRFSYHDREEWTDRISNGQVSVGGVRARAGTAVTGQDLVSYTVRVREPQVDFSYSTVFEDENLLVVSKSGNLPVHAGGSYVRHTLITRLREDLRMAGLDLVNRLDRETSGLVMLSKNKKTLTRMHDQLKAREVKKAYFALVHGNPRWNHLVVDECIAPPDPNYPIPRWRVGVEGGKEAITKLLLARRLPLFALVLIHLLTGRTNQIRAHLAHIGHPVVGDKVYGLGRRLVEEHLESGLTPEVRAHLILPRHALHCCVLSFRHPWTADMLTLEAPIPKDLEGFLAAVSPCSPVELPEPHAIWDRIA